MLRQAHPVAKINWLVNTAFADAIAHPPMLDGVVGFDRRTLSGFGWRLPATREGFGLWRQLRRSRYDAVYDLQGLARSGLLTWLTRSPRRVGFADAREGSRLGYNTRHVVDQSAHTVDRMITLLTADGLPKPEQPDMQLYVGADDRQSVDELAKQEGIEAQRYACIAPTAKWRCKCWPIEHYTQIAIRLLTQSDDRVKRLVVLASPHEREQVQPMIDALEANKAAASRVYLPSTSVGQLMAWIQHARLLICNDSASLHMAVGLGTPSVSIFGPTDPRTVGPYQQDGSVVQAEPAKQPGFVFDYRRLDDDNRLISQVGIDEVWQQCLHQLDNN